MTFPVGLAIFRSFIFIALHPLWGLPDKKPPCAKVPASVHHSELLLERRFVYASDMDASVSTAQHSGRIAIIGGGITGLSAAYRLLGLGKRVVLFEAGSRLGGSIGTLSENGWLCEAGPNSLLEGEPQLAQLIAELGLESERIEANRESKKRFIVRNGQLCPLPMSPPALFTTKLFSGGTKWRLFTELLQKPRERPTDVSLARMIGDHFGAEAVAYGLNPFVSGVYAGDPERLSAKHAFPKLWEIERTTGSIIRGQIGAAKQRKAEGRPKPQIVSFKKGLQTLIDALAAKVPPDSLRLQTKVETLKRGPAGWIVVSSDATGRRVEDSCSSVICAVPAPALASLAIGAESEHPLDSLTEVEHPPVTSLFLGYRREQVRHPLDGFGALIPAVERRSELGILFSSSLFPGRAPEGHVALTVMVGGMRQPEIARLSPDELLAKITPDLRELLGVSGEPVYRRCHRWPQAIPQYNLGYERHLEAMASCERAHPGLCIGGNARDGIAVPSCLISGLRLADKAV